MDKIRKKERKNWFYSYNVIFDLDIPYYAKIVYLYLCRCADEESQAFPSYSTIATKCSISRRSAIRAVKILQEIGLLEKQNRIIESNGKIINTSNIYYIYDAPQTLNQEQKVVTDSHQGWCQCDTRVVTDSHQGGDTLALKGLPIEGLPIEGLPLLHPNDSNYIHDTIATTEETSEHEVVVVDKSLDQPVKKPTADEIKKVQEIARTEGLKLTKRNIEELWKIADGDLEQIENGIKASVQYAKKYEVRNMWGLIKDSVAVGRLPALIPSALFQKEAEIAKKAEKYRDVYMS